MKKFRFILIFFVLVLSFLFYLNLNYSTPILMYHSFDKNRKNYASIDLDIFYKQMEYIKEKKYNVISLDEYCRFLIKNNRHPKKSVVITIDDGYKDNLKAIEILKKFDFPATIFLIVSKINKNGYLTEEDIKNFLKDTKITIGSHTLTHRYLPELNKKDLEKEISLSKKILEKKFPVDINTIAYPVGGFDKRVLEEVEKAGFLCACTTNRGFSNKLNLFAIRRIKITNKDLGFRLWIKLTGFYNIFKKLKKPY